MFSNMAKFENMMKNSLKKKRFHPYKRNLYQTGKTENMPVVDGRLVS